MPPKPKKSPSPPPPPLPEFYYIPELTKTFFQKFKDRDTRRFPRDNYVNNVTHAFQYYIDLQIIIDSGDTRGFNIGNDIRKTTQLANNLVKFKDNFPAFKELSQVPLSTYEKLEDKIIIPTIWPSVNIDIRRLTTMGKEILAILLAICIDAKKELKRDIPLVAQDITLDDCYIGVRKKKFRDYLNEVYGDTISREIEDIIIEI